METIVLGEIQKFLITAFLVISAIVFVSSTVSCIRKIVKNWIHPDLGKKTGISMALQFSAALIVAIGLLRFSVRYCNFYVLGPGEPALELWEEAFSSFFAALRSFGVSEDYSRYMQELHHMTAQMLPAEHPNVALYSNAVLLYATLLNLLAPIVGGAVVMEALAGIFPKIKLGWAYLQVLRPKYFFSELNENSLALIKSIRQTRIKGRPVLIVADVHSSDKESREFELWQEAKQYGAICLQDDLQHISKPKCGKREYYLMNADEFTNLQLLTELTEGDNLKALYNARVYLFVQSDAYVQIEKQLLDRLSDKKNKPVIIPINGYRNLVQNLLIDVPLYEPLVHKADPTKLDLTIMGNGMIGTEAFLNAYWLGQLMVSRNDTVDDCELTIHVVSKDSEEVFWSKIDYVNPEIRKTVEILSNSTKKEEKPDPEETPEEQKKKAHHPLDINEAGQRNKPYCKVRYTQADVKLGNLGDYGNQEMLQSDYFIIALGNDADNIAVAERIRLAVGKQNQEAKVNQGRKTVIAYAVFDSNMAQILNEHKRYQSRDEKITDVYMHAFGSLDQVYSCENVYMSQSALMAEETGDAYVKAHHHSDHIQDNKKRADGQENGNYNYWASLARASHIKYKVFSLGWITGSVFDYAADGWTEPAGKKNKLITVNADEHHQERIQQICKGFKQIAIDAKLTQGDTSAAEKKADLERKKHCLAWLEHRRWNAFTRVMGYQYIDAETILNHKGAQKDMGLKLHACLVEAKRPEINGDNSFILADFTADGKVNTETALLFKKEEAKDFLDLVSRHRRDKLEKGEDFKQYDYYRYEFGDYQTLEDTVRRVCDQHKIIAALPEGLRNLVYGADRMIVRYMCSVGALKGAAAFEDAWYIPIEWGTKPAKQTKEKAAKTKQPV